MAKKKVAEVAAENAAPVIAYKGFDKDFKCRDYQFKMGESFTHDGDVKLLESGFHACLYPMDVFNFYAPNDSQFAQVELGGVSEEAEESCSKRAAKTISIKASLTIPMLISASIEYVTKLCSPADAKHATGDQSASSATGDQSASSATGDQSASSATGDQSASSATGYRSASSATGDRSASSATGDRSASSATGDQSASSATGYRSASSATGDQSASSATGDQSASSATGYRSASSATGDRSASSATGNNAVAAAFGLYSKAMADVTGLIIVAWWDDKADRKRMTIGYVGENGIKENTWYGADESGALVEK